MACGSRVYIPPPDLATLCHLAPSPLVEPRRDTQLHLPRMRDPGQESGLGPFPKDPGNQRMGPTLTSAGWRSVQALGGGLFYRNVKEGKMRE